MNTPSDRSRYSPVTELNTRCGDSPHRIVILLENKQSLPITSLFPELYRRKLELGSIEKASPMDNEVPSAGTWFPQAICRSLIWKIFPMVIEFSFPLI